MNNMEKQFVTREEFELVKAIRMAPKYTDFEVMKRPSAEYPDGVIIRVKISTSKLIHSPEGKMSESGV